MSAVNVPCPLAVPDPLPLAPLPLIVAEPLPLKVLPPLTSICTEPILRLAEPLDVSLELIEPLTPSGPTLSDPLD